MNKCFWIGLSFRICLWRLLGPEIALRLEKHLDFFTQIVIVEMVYHAVRYLTMQYQHFLSDQFRENWILLLFRVFLEVEGLT